VGATVKAPGTTSKADLGVSDDLQRNELTLTERYEIPETFVKGDGAVARFELEANIITEHARLPDRVSRRTPIDLPYPLWVEQKTRVTLPEDWPVETAAYQIEGPGVRYAAQLAESNHEITQALRFSTTRDHVAAEDAADYYAKVTQIRDDAFLTISSPGVSLPHSFGDIAWPVVLTVLAGLALAAVLVRHVWRAPGQPLPDPRPDAPSGLGGWLALVTLGVLIAPVMLAIALWGERTMLNADVYATVGSQFSSAWIAFVVKVAVLALVFLEAALFVTSLLLPLLFFSRRRTFPRVFIAFTVTATVYALLSAAFLWRLYGSDSKDVVSAFAELVRSVLQAGIWSAYMLRSQRVRATFTRR
jgi:hypothetical protein